MATLPRIFLALTCFLWAFTASGQVNPAYGYFRDPLGLTIHLAGNYGELRPGHFHMGLDIKTNGRINFPVYAAADGYVSHVKIEAGGFGNAVYVAHPNGYTTVYVHLNRFAPGLAEYVKARQYKLEQWSVFLDIPPDLFPVRKGQLIAYSGNTGGSLAPHLHFEVRETQPDINRNPLLFGLPVVDKTPPALLRVAVYDGSESSYMQMPHVLPLIRNREGGYTVPGGTVTTRASKVRLAIGAVDHQDGSANALGIYSAFASEDGQAISGFVLDSISYDNTRFVDAHTDFALKATGGPYVEFLNPLPGNQLGIYRVSNGDGLVHLDDGQAHRVSIVVKDALGNRSEAHFTIRKEGPAPLDEQGDFFLPNQVNVFENDSFQLYLPGDCLPDAVRPVYERKGKAGGDALSPSYSVVNPWIPALDSITVSIRPAGIWSDSGMAAHCVIEDAGLGHRQFGSVTWNRGWASAKFRAFGGFRLLRDDVSPVLRPIGWGDGSEVRGRSSLSVTASDNMGNPVNFRAELDGSWLMFSRRGETYTYAFDKHFSPGTHVLTLSVEDPAGNETKESYHLTL